MSPWKLPCPSKQGWKYLSGHEQGWDEGEASEAAFKKAFI